MTQAREHLAFYGTLKNLKGPELAAAVQEALEAVNLKAEIDVRAGAFSGGKPTPTNPQTSLSFLSLELSDTTIYEP